MQGAQPFAPPQPGPLAAVSPTQEAAEPPGAPLEPLGNRRGCNCSHYLEIIISEFPRLSYLQYTAHEDHIPGV